MVDYSDSWTPAGDFGIVEDINTTGGLRVVADSSERLSIPAPRRKKGMKVIQADNNITYILNTTNLGTLTEADFVQESPGDVYVSADNTFTGTNTFTKYVTGSITGSDAIFSSITSSNDVKIGSGPLISVGRGSGDSDFSVAFGHESLDSNTIGYSNVAIGYQTLKNNTEGYTNVAIGNSTLRDNITGDDNTAVGSAAMLSNTVGYNNVAIGRYTLYQNVSSSNHVAVGAYALYSVTGALEDTGPNVGIGAYSLYNNQTGSYNTAVGSDTLFNNVFGDYNVAVGHQALVSNVDGHWNTAVGHTSLYNNVGVANTSIGAFSMVLNEQGEYNVAVGTDTLFSNLNGNYNVAIGHYSIRSNTSGIYNTAFGAYSLTAHTNGTRNASIGSLALYSLKNGSRNSVLGNGSLYNALSGSNNVAVGNLAGFNLLTGSYNVFIGDNAGVGETHLENTVIIRTNQERLRIDSEGNMSVNGTLVADVKISGSTSSPIQATSYVLSANDRGKTLLLSSSITQAITCSSGLDTGFNCTFIQMGSGQLVLSGASGVELYNRQNHSSSAGQYAAISIISIDSNKFIIAGDTM